MTSFILRKYWYLGFILIAILVLYSSSLSVYFAQDDFFHFKASLTDGSLKGFARLFGFYKFEDRGYAFYRPIFREAFYNIYYSLFGLQHLPFRILVVSLHFANSVIVFFLVYKIVANKTVAFFSSLFTAITSANAAGIFFIAAGVQTIGVTFFILLSIYSVVLYLEERKIKYKLLSFVFFICALATHELSVALAPLIALFIFIKSNGSFKERALLSIKETFFYFLVLIVFVYLDLFHIGFSNKELQYQPSFSIKQTLNSFAWYIAWSLGLPEMTLDFVGSGLHLNPNLMKYWGGYFKIIFPCFFILLALIIGSFFSVWAKKKEKLFDHKLLIFVVWFAIALGPIIFLPFHKFSYYLHPALPAFWTALSYIIFVSFEIIAKKSKNLAKVFFGTFVSVVFLISTTSVALANVTYWSANRGRIAKKIISSFENEHKFLVKGAIIYIQNDPNYPEIARDWGGSSKQAFFALSGSDAFQLLYHDPNIKVYYEDVGGIHENIDKESVVNFVAKIN